jgi:hypothetical protein
MILSRNWIGSETMAAIPSFLASSGYCSLLSPLPSGMMIGLPAKVSVMLLGALRGPLVRYLAL